MVDTTESTGEQGPQAVLPARPYQGGRSRPQYVPRPDLYSFYYNGNRLSFHPRNHLSHSPGTFPLQPPLPAYAGGAPFLPRGYYVNQGQQPRAEWQNYRGRGRGRGRGHGYVTESTE